jgi:uncharacterized membrane protein
MLQFTTYVSQLFRKSHLLFVVVAVPICLFLITCNKPFLGADEQWHTLRTWQTAHFQPYQSQNFDKNKLPKPLDDYIVGNWQLETDQPLRPDITVANVKGETVLSSSTEMVLPTWYSWSTSLYSFVPYIPPALGMQVAMLFPTTVPQILFAAKTGSAIFYILLIAFALYTLRNLRLKWLFFAVGLLPPVLYQASTITADTFTIGITFLFLALLLRENSVSSDEEVQPNKLRYGIIVTALLVAFIKLAYVPLIVLLLFVRQPLYLSYNRHWAISAKLQRIRMPNWLSYLVERRLSILLNLIVGAVALFFYKLGSYVSANKGDILGLDSRINPAEQLNFMLTHPIDALLMIPRTVVGNFSSYFQTNFGYALTTPEAGLVYEILTILLVLVLVLQFEIKTVRNFNIAFGLTSGAVTALIFVAMYTANTIPGQLTADGVAARYLAVMLPAFIYIISIVIPQRIKLATSKIKVFMPATTVGLIVVINIVLLADWYQQMQSIVLNY